jgi:hypothetical protein
LEFLGSDSGQGVYVRLGRGMADARGRKTLDAREGFLACPIEIVNAAAGPRVPPPTGSGRGGLAEDNHLLARSDLQQLDFQNSIGQRGVHLFRVYVRR